MFCGCLALQVPEVDGIWAITEYIGVLSCSFKDCDSIYSRMAVLECGHAAWPSYLRRRIATIL